MTELTKLNFTTATDPGGDYKVIEMIDISKTTRKFRNCTIRFDRGGFIGDGEVIFYLSNCTIYGNGTISGCRIEKKIEDGVTYDEGFRVRDAKSFIISHCKFTADLTFGLRVIGATYDMDVHSCIFSGCQKGIYIESNGNGLPNCNTVRGCLFEYCSTNPVKLECIVTDENGTRTEYAYSWHFIDCRFENGNGKSIMGINTKIDHLRMEKNLKNVTWLVLQSDCEVDTEVHALSDNEPVSTSTWRIVVMGSNNHVRARFVRFNPYGIISYSNHNSWDIINENLTFQTPTAFVFDPDDHFCLNGWNKDTDYMGKNLVTATNVSINTSDPDTVIEVPDGSCYPLSASSAYVTVTIDSKKNDMYISGTFYPVFTSTANSQQVKLFHEFKMNPVSKWYRYVAASNTVPTEPVGNNTVESVTKKIYTPLTGKKMYLRDVVYSQDKLLFDYPILHTPEEGENYNPKRKDNLIHLHGPYLNHIIHNFSFKPKGLLHYINPLGKVFYYSQSQDKYYAGDIEIPYNSYVDMGVIEQNPDGGIPYIIRDLLNVDVELYDFNGNHLFLHAQRANTSQYFTITVKESCGMTYKTSNVVGTIAINESVGYVIAWVVSA